MMCIHRAISLSHSLRFASIVHAYGHWAENKSSIFTPQSGVLRNLKANSSNQSPIIKGYGGNHAYPEAKTVILVVEDDPCTREVLIRVLALIRPGVEIVPAETAEEALKILVAPEVVATLELLVIDISLPGDMDGTELWEECRTRVPGVPVMLISGASIALYRPFFQKYGVFPPFLRKPFSAGDFRSMYELLLPGHK